MRTPILVLSWFLLLGLACADEVVLQNGRSIRGEIVRENKREIVVLLEGGSKLKLPRSTVKEVIRTSDSGKEPKAKSGAQTSQKSVEPAWRFPQGLVLKYRMTAVTTVSHDSEERVGKQIDDFEVHGGGVSKAQTRADVIVTRRRIETRSKDKVLESFDSARGDRASKKKLGDSVGHKITFDLTSRGEGKLVGVNGRTVGTLSPADQKKNQISLIDGLLGFEVKGMIGTFPEGPLSVGSPKWRTKLVMGEAVRYILTASVSKISARELSVRLSGTAKFTGSIDGWPKGVRIGVGRLTGRARFSLEGHLVSSKMTLKMHARDQRDTVRMTLKVTTALVK